jgi:hypothetical protein
MLRAAAGDSDQNPDKNHHNDETSGYQTAASGRSGAMARPRSFGMRRHRQQNPEPDRGTQGRLTIATSARRFSVDGEAGVFARANRLSSLG